jgi:hypothetical protein
MFPDHHAIRIMSYTCPVVDMAWILILILYPFFVLWHLNLLPVERALVLGAFTSGLPVAVVSILHALYGLNHDVSGWSGTAQLEVILYFPLLLSDTIISDNPNQASLSLIVCNLVIIVTRLYQIIRRTRIQVNCPAFRLRLARRKARDVGHPQGGSGHRVSTLQPRISSRKTPTRLHIDLMELSGRFGLGTRSSNSSTETENGWQPRYSRLGLLNTITSIDSGLPLEFARCQVFQHSPSVYLPEPELAHLN